MLKTFIVVQWKFEGVHFWREAPAEVDFLRLPHRHEFYCTARIPVSHDNRELEFFIVKRFLQNFTSEWPWSLNGKSCEMMATEIINKITEKFGLRKGVTVSVFEDGENGAVVEN